MTDIGEPRHTERIPGKLESDRRIFASTILAIVGELVELTRHRRPDGVIEILWRLILRDSAHRGPESDGSGQCAKQDREVVTIPDSMSERMDRSLENFDIRSFLAVYDMGSNPTSDLLCPLAWNV